MTLDEAKKEMVKFVELKTTLRPAFVDVILKAEEVKHGHWVHGKELSRDYIGDICVRVHYDKYWCSECNYTVERLPLWDYCPYCGADMRGEQDE